MTRDTNVSGTNQIMRPYFLVICALALFLPSACSSGQKTPDIVDVWVDSRLELREIPIEKFGENLTLKYKGQACPIKIDGSGMTAFHHGQQIPLLHDPEKDLLLFDGESYRRKSTANKTMVVGSWIESDEQGNVVPNGKTVSINQIASGDYYLQGYLKSREALLQFVEGKGLFIKERKDYYGNWIDEEIRLEKAGNTTILVIEGWSEGENWVYRYRKAN